MWNAEMNESQAGIKIARRSINNPRYANDTTVMAESEEQLKRLLIRVKEETEKASLKLNIQKMKIIASGPITSREKLGAVTDCISLGSEITADRDWAIKLRRLLLGRKAMTYNSTPLQYSCLKNPMDGGAWWAAVHGVARSRTQLSDFTLTFHFHALEDEMATHSSVLAWRIPWTEEPGGLLSMGSHRVGHDWSDLAAAAAT